MLRIVADNVGVTVENREMLIDRIYSGPSPFPVQIALPCGWTYEMKDVLDVPHDTQRCPCGLHWAVVYTEPIDDIIRELEA